MECVELVPEPRPWSQMEVDPNRLIEICRMGDAVLLEKEKLVEINQQHNGVREALGAVRRKEAQDHSVWADFGGFFMRQPAEALTEELKSDKVRLEDDREKVRLLLKERCKKLVDAHPSVSEMNPDTLSFLLSVGEQQKTKPTGLRRGFLLQ